MKITTGRQQAPYAVVIYGQEGVGKSTLGAQFPSPLFLDVEGSTARMDVARLPVPATWSEALQILAKLTASPPQGYQTLVIDTWDWLLGLLTQHMIALAPTSKSGEKTMASYGYGRGYDRQAEECARFFDSLDFLRHATGWHVVLLAHAAIRKFELPEEASSYDRWEMKVDRRPASGNNPLSLTKEWADMILFCRYKTMVSTPEEGGKAKASGKRRVMHSQHSATWDAKNRDGLPDEMPLDYQQIAHLFTVPTVKKNLTVPVVQPAQPAPLPEPPPPPSQEKPAYILQLDALLAGADMTDVDLMRVVSRKGSYPADTPYQNMAPDFIIEKVIPYFHTIEARHKELKKGDKTQ